MSSPGVGCSVSRADLDIFDPMVPIIQAAQAAGHTSAVACGPSRVSVVQAAGFTAFGIGPTRSRDAARRLPLQEVDVTREERDLRERFAGRSGARAEDVWALARHWRPDIVVADVAQMDGEPPPAMPRYETLGPTQVAADRARLLAALSKAEEAGLTQT